MVAFPIHASQTKILQRVTKSSFGDHKIWKPYALYDLLYLFKVVFNVSWPKSCTHLLKSTSNPKCSLGRHDVLTCMLTSQMAQTHYVLLHEPRGRVQRATAVVSKTTNSTTDAAPPHNESGVSIRCCTREWLCVTCLDPASVLTFKRATIEHSTRHECV